MDGMLEELDEAKGVIEKLSAECNMKGELSENLKRVNSEQFAKLQEANLRIEKLTQELNEKAEELSIEKKRCEDLGQNLIKQESFVKNLSVSNDKLRADADEKFLKLEEENRSLILAFDDTSEKCMHQEQKICAYKVEIEGLKNSLLLSQRKCSEVEERFMAHKELRETDDMLTVLNDENSKVRDQLKWKTEQFKHLEEALEKVRVQFKVNKKEWELEKDTLLDEISSLQARLDSQMLISKDLQNKLEMCNQALAHEESRRKRLEVQVTDFETRFENVFGECEHAKMQLDEMTAQRDKEIAALRSSLGTKDSYLKEREYQTGKLEQENQELRSAIKELQTGQIQEAGASSSFIKLQKKLKSLESAHGECAATLRAKEVEWTSQLEEILSYLNVCKSELSRRETTIKDLEAMLEGHYSSEMQLKLQNEEISAILLVLNQGISEAQMKLAKELAEVYMHDQDREEEISLLMKQLEVQNVALVKAHKDIEEERDKAVSLMKRMESLDLVEEQLHLKQKELDRYKEMFPESSEYQHHLKEHALLMEHDATEKLKEVSNALNRETAELAEQESVYMRVQSLELIEEQYKLKLKELDQWENAELAEKEFVYMQVQSLELIEEQYKSKLKELDQCMIMLEESSRDHIQLNEQVVQIECEARERIREACSALEEANAELSDKICEGNQIDFEMHMWKSIAERLKVDLEETYEMRRELEASLLAEVRVGEIIKQEKDGLIQLLKVKDGKIESLKRQVMLLEEGLEIIELEATSWSGTESATSFESVRDSFLQIIREKDETLERLQKEVECLEQDSLRREFEVAVLSQLGAERTFEHEKEKLIQMVEKKNMRIDQLMQLVESLEHNFNGSLKSFSSQLDEKQTEISLVHQAMEKINAAEILAVIETEEKKMMILELEDNINELQQKLKLQETSLGNAKDKAIKIEADLEAKESEMRTLTNQMKTKLSCSDAAIDELKSEKSILVEDVMKLSSEKEDLMGIIGGIGNRIGEFSNSDRELFGLLEKIMLSFGNESQKMEVKCDDEPSFSKKNSSEMKRFEVTPETRSPFRELNS